MIDQPPDSDCPSPPDASRQPNAAPGSSPDRGPDRSPEPGQGLASRRAAFDLLHKVLIERRLLDDALADMVADQGNSGEPESQTMSSRDRAFVRLLVGTTLRRLGQIDALIAHAVSRPLPRQAAAVRDVLRLGICQLLFLQTPRHAAVSTSVDLAGQVNVQSFKGLVNAVLRRMAEEGPDLVAQQDAARINTPEWLWQSWVKAHGGDRARAIASSHLNEAPLDISVKADPVRWAGLLSGTVLPTGTIRRPAGGSILDLPGFGDGAWWIQDVAAAMPARLLGPVDGLRVLDMCAAPGGKTAQLAAAGARVTAVDRSAKRLERVRQNLQRLNLGAELIASDALLLEPAEPFDAVLVDAPCSATGTIRRHPDIPRVKGHHDVGKLAAAQKALLRRAIELVKPGGMVVWCTCSLQPEEGEGQIDALIAGGAPVDRVPIDAGEIGGLADALTASGDVRTLPHFSPMSAPAVGDAGLEGMNGGGMDGFHIARLRRR